MRYSKLTHVGFRAHVKIASRIVSYRFNKRLAGKNVEWDVKRYSVQFSLVKVLRPSRVDTERVNSETFLLANLMVSINQSYIFRVVQVIKSLQDPLEAGNNLPGINNNVRERGLEQKCFKR